MNSSVLILLAGLRWFICIYMYMCILHILVLRCEQLGVDTVGRLRWFICIYMYMCILHISVLRCEQLSVDTVGRLRWFICIYMYTCILHISVLRCEQLSVDTVDGLSVYTCTCVFYTFQFCVVNSSVLILLAGLRWFICIYMYMCILHISVLRCEQLGINTVGGTWTVHLGLHADLYHR